MVAVAQYVEAVRVVEVLEAEVAIVTVVAMEVAVAVVAEDLVEAGAVINPIKNVKQC